MGGATAHIMTHLGHVLQAFNQIKNLTSPCWSVGKYRHVFSSEGVDQKGTHTSFKYLTLPTVPIIHWCKPEKHNQDWVNSFSFCSHFQWHWQSCQFTLQHLFSKLDLHLWYPDTCWWSGNSLVVECQTHDWKIMELDSSPSRSGRWVFRMRYVKLHSFWDWVTYR